MTILTACFLAVCALLMTTREIVLSPDADPFPCASLVVRMAMLSCAAALFWLAVVFFTHARDYAGPAAGPICAVSNVMMLYNLIMLLNLLGQRRGRPFVRKLKELTQPHRYRVT